MYGGSSADIAVRTRMTVTSGQTQGWSFSLKHSAPWTQYYGGNFSASGVTINGTNTATVQTGSPPDTNNTAIRTGYNGYTQGIIIDSNTIITLGPTTDFVTSRACYRVTAPTSNGTYPTTLQFTHDIGNPPVRSVVTQQGRSNVPCAKNFILNIKVGDCSPQTYPSCTLLSGPFQGNAAEPQTPLPPGAAGMDFKRADANSDGNIDITDAIVTLNFLFLAGPVPSCKDAADTNDDERVDVSDAVYSLAYQFNGGAAPPSPFPNCGPDLTDEIVLLIDCQSYSQCDQTDSDGDGLTDNYENTVTHTRFTKPTTDKDTDGDCFTDGQEVLPTGVPSSSSGGALNISLLGADPKKKDLFVEIDYMVAADHSHLPDSQVLQPVFTAFANHDIAIHFDTGVAPYNLGGGGSLPHQNQIDLNTARNSVKPANFDKINRDTVFHYCVFGHDNTFLPYGGEGEICGVNFVVTIGGG